MLEDERKTVLMYIFPYKVKSQRKRSDGVRGGRSDGVEGGLSVSGGVGFLCF